jgi:hypothetical protein
VLFQQHFPRQVQRLHLDGHFPPANLGLRPAWPHQRPRQFHTLDVGELWCVQLWLLFITQRKRCSTIFSKKLADYKRGLRYYLALEFVIMLSNPVMREVCQWSVVVHAAAVLMRDRTMGRIANIFIVIYFLRTKRMRLYFEFSPVEGCRLPTLHKKKTDGQR